MMAPVTALRCVIDSMVFDAIAQDRALLDEVDRLTRARRLELLAALETMEEIAATPDEEHRRRLRKVRVLVVPPPAGARGDRRLARMRTSPGVSEEDARIAVTAAAHDVPLVTEDRDLERAMAAHLPGTQVWHWLGDLLPRIQALAQQLPAPPRRRR
jgi:predicted nucleic acid-binding protein